MKKFNVLRLAKCWQKCWQKQTKGLTPLRSVNPNSGTKVELEAKTILLSLHFLPPPCHRDRISRCVFRLQSHSQTYTAHNG